MLRDELLAEYKRLGIRPIFGGDHESSGDDGNSTDGASGASADGSSGTEGATSGTKDGETGTSGFTPITSQADFDRLIQDRIRRATDTATREAETSLRARIQQEADEEAARKNGEFETLYQTEVKKREQAEADAKKERLSNLRAVVAAKHTLPDELAELLQGETEADLTSHAERLAKLVPERTAPDNDAGTTNAGGGKKTQQKTPEFKYTSPGKKVKYPGT